MAQTSSRSSEVTQTAVGLTLLGWTLSLLAGVEGAAPDYDRILAAGYHSIEIAAVPVAYGAARFLFYYVAFLALIGLPARLFWGHSLLPIAAAGTLPIALVASRIVVLEAGALSILPSLAVLALAGHIGYVAGGAVQRDPSWRGFAVRLAAALTLMAVMLFFYRWAVRYHWRDAAQEAPFVFAATYAAGVVAAAALLFVRRERHRLETLIGVLACLAFLAPLRAVEWTGSPRIAVASTVAGQDADSIPRIFLISIDTIRGDRLSSINPAARPTPHLDRLAADSVLFLNAVAAAPWTEPAMDSLMKGVAPYIETTRYFYQKAPMPTLADYLAGEGYYAKGFSGNPLLSPPSSIVSGFHSLDVFAPDRIGMSPISEAIAQRWPERFVRGGATRELTDMALRWVKANEARRFFLWLHYYDPHRPYAPPLEFLPDVKLTSSLGFLTRPTWSDVISTHRRGEIRLLYDSEVAYVDEAVGRLMEDLRQRDLYDESLIVVVGDHGEEFWEHGFTGHGHSMYQEQLHVPLLIKLPGSAVTRRIQSFVPVQAVLPTLLALCGIEHEPARGWTSPLTPLLSAESGDEYPAPIISGAPIYHDLMESVIVNHQKYIRNRHSGSEEYYDLREDALEQRPLSEESFRELARAREALAQHDETAQGIREEYGLEAASASASAEDMERLRSLGYIQ